jgi:TonB family protein
MSRLSLFTAVMLLWMRSSSFAQPITTLAGSDNLGIGIEQTGVLVFPSSMIGEGVYSGEASAVISVDADGKLVDWLITGFTHQAFADAASQALKRWKYQPAVVRGHRRASSADILFEFRTEGVVVMTLPGTLLRQAARGHTDTHYIYTPCHLRDLDRIPTPIHVVSPVARHNGPIRTVTVGFYIDEEGRVRIPTVEMESVEDALAAASVAAVEQWRFEPPIRKGQRVLVYVQQDFTFMPKD